MAFPVNSVLDAFTRADGAAGAAWSKIWSGDNDLQIVSNQLTAGSGLWANGGWNAVTFGPDCEAYIAIPTVPVATFCVYARMSVLNTAGGPNGYRVFFDGSSTIRIQRLDSGTPATLGADITQALSNGDAIGIECNGSTITAYRKPSGGSWAALGNRTDATYGSAGYIGLECYSNSGRFDDFGGGAINTVTLQQEGYRFRADDGHESGATWLADQDTAIERGVDTPTRLRVLLNAAGDVAAAQYQLEWKKSTDSVWRKVEP